MYIYIDIYKYIYIYRYLYIWFYGGRWEKGWRGSAYIFANRPMQNVARQDMAAVAVTTSRFTSDLQRRYSSLAMQMGSSGVELQTQVPPLSDTMEALTAMMYAMAKKVAMPARISVVKMAPFRSVGYPNDVSQRGPHTPTSSLPCDPRIRRRRCPEKAPWGSGGGLGVGGFLVSYMTGAIEFKPSADDARGDLLVHGVGPSHGGRFGKLDTRYAARQKSKKPGLGLNRNGRATRDLPWPFLCV